MNELLKKDITMKIISVLFAVILWFLVLDNVNPYITKNLTVPLIVQNDDSLADRNILLKSDYSRSVGITIRGRKDQVNNMSATDFIVKLDFSRVKSVNDTQLTIDNPIYIGKANKSDFKMELSTRTVALSLESIKKSPIAIKVSTSGIPKSGYKVVGISVDPKEVSIQGPDSLLKTVNEVRVAVNIANLDKSTTFEQACRVYDAKNNEIPQLSKGLTARVTVVLAREVAIRPVIKGKPAPNYSEVWSRVSPETVLVTGDSEVLSQMTQVSTKPVDIEDMKGNINIASSLVLPGGIKVYNPPDKIVVSVGIEPLTTRDFTISKDQIEFLNTEIDNSLSYEIQNPEIVIGVKGPKSELDKLGVGDISPSIDLVGLAEGTYKLPLKVILPEGFRVVKDCEIEVLVQKRG